MRPSGQSPARDFLESRERAMRKRFAGSFDALVRMGANYEIDNRFKPLKGEARPLWEFKEEDQRIHCSREQQGAAVRVILLNGFVKDRGQGKKHEAQAIETGLGLYREYR